MNKKISFEFLQAIQLPIILKKEIISIDDETARLKYIGNIFNNILDNDKPTSSENMPQA